MVAVPQSMSEGAAGRLLLLDHAEAEGVDRLRAAVARMSRHMGQASRVVGLSPTEVSVLANLVRHGPARMTALAARESLNPTMVSRLVHHLEHKCLVKRSQDPLDARAVVVVATESGRSLHREVLTERRRILEWALEVLDADERATLFQAIPVLQRVATHMEARGG